MSSTGSRLNFTGQLFKGDRRQNGGRRAQAQDPAASKSGNRYSTLPDLRFLNHNNPPPTATSLLASGSKNSANIQHYQALQDAEAWYTGTVTLLKEKLALCERLRDGLGEVNMLLRSIEATKADLGQESGRSIQQSALSMEVSTAVESVTTAKAIDAAAFPSEQQAFSSSIESGNTESNLKSMEEAVQEWLKDIRVARAKWIAGGRDMEYRIGLR